MRMDHLPAILGGGGGAAAAAFVVDAAVVAKRYCHVPQDPDDGPRFFHEWEALLDDATVYFRAARNPQFFHLCLPFLQ
jgi:hypothetical protein